ncbi:hypothetical protein COL26b_013723 [Colletotrichum chrysophilum]|uniref:uncharacterized protein n=1 Tax=Colletotrichum chrysophilum TaxID=1836956 RepID=UPI002300A856|nr:uncharacterized protein COL26b_013723 [Colletotrichum chrysophilum]KAJ0361444.1 hypothetical protein COL26b_013723 [Colletotrichum chrysophilum]
MLGRQDPAREREQRRRNEEREQDRQDARDWQQRVNDDLARLEQQTRQREEERQARERAERERQGRSLKSEARRDDGKIGFGMIQAVQCSPVIVK